MTRTASDAKQLLEILVWLDAFFCALFSKERPYDVVRKLVKHSRKNGQFFPLSCTIEMKGF
jgi:hypothetical protein